MPDEYGQMTDVERQIRLAELRAQSRGWDALAGGIPDPNTFSAAKIGVPESYEAEAARKRIEELQAKNAADQALLDRAINSRVQGERATAGAEQYGLPAAAAAAPPKPSGMTMNEAIMAGGGEVGGTPVVPGAATAQAAAPAPKNIIVSRRTPEGKIVFETVPAPPAGAAALQAPGGGGDEYAGPGLGIEEWKRQALAENPMRAAATAAHPGLNPSGQTSSGFLVREGGGGFGPSQQLPGLDKSYEEVSATSSPLVQDMWLEQKAKAMGIGREAAALQESTTRSRLGGAQAGLAEEQTRRLKDPSIEVRENFAMHDAIMQRINPQVAQNVGAKLQAAIDVLTQQMGGPPPTSIIDAVRNRIFTEETGRSYDEMLNQVMGTVPGVAAAKARVPGILG